MRYQDRRGRHPWGPWARRRRLAAMLGTLVTALLVEGGTGLGRWLLGLVWAWMLPVGR